LMPLLELFPAKWVAQNQAAASCHHQPSVTLGHKREENWLARTARGGCV
jgi:hypothetical protein